MSTLTLLALIVAGVAVAYLLEEWSERSGSLKNGIKSVPNETLSNHLFTGFPEGYYTDLGGKRVEEGEWLFLLIFIYFIWVTAGEMNFGFTLIYTMMALFGMIVYVGEKIAPKRMSGTAFMVGNPKWGVIGVPIGLAFIPLLNYAGVLGGGLLALGSSTNLVIALAFAAPIVEEYFFTTMMTPSAAEQWGVAGGIIPVVVAWVALHYFAWAPFTLAGVLVLVAFRSINYILAVKYRTMWHALVAHILANGGVLLLSGGI